MAKAKGSLKTGGRKAGTPNKISGAVKDAVLKAVSMSGAELPGTKAEKADGMANYLKHQSIQNPQAFMALLGRVLPLQVIGAEDDGTIKIEVEFVKSGE